MSKGRYGNYGGQYIPETLMNAVLELEEAYGKYSKDPEFNKELDDLLKNYAGRPSLLYYAEKMTKDLGGAKIYLKREDLNHTGSQDSMGWQLQPQQHLWEWNVKSSWEKKTRTDRH